MEREGELHGGDTCYKGRTFEELQNNTLAFG